MKISPEELAEAPIQGGGETTNDVQQYAKVVHDPALYIRDVLWSYWSATGRRSGSPSGK
jgi:hypothetical protein